jgi:hypothetical protein
VICLSGPRGFLHALGRTVTLGANTQSEKLQVTIAEGLETR